MSHPDPNNPLPRVTELPWFTLEINRLAAELADIRAKLAPLLAGETVECPACDGTGEIDTMPETLRCGKCADTPGHIPLDTASMGTVEMVDLIVKRFETQLGVNEWNNAETWGKTVRELSQRVELFVQDSVNLSKARQQIEALTQRAEAAEQRAAETVLQLDGLTQGKWTQLQIDRAKELGELQHRVYELQEENTRLKDRVAELEREMARGMSVAHEREACAVIALGSRSATPHHQICEYIADTIRARGDK